MGYKIDTGVISQEDEFIGHGDYQCMMEMVHLENENAKLKDQLEQSEVDRKSATLQCESMRKDQNTLSVVEKENKRLRENWENLEKWVKGKKINFTGDDRFWRGYDDFHGDVRAKMKELEKGGE